MGGKETTVNPFLQFLIYYLQLILLTLGLFVLCGFAVYLLSRAFSALLGQGRSRRFFDVTAAIGTPVHELGHAIMCPIFAHKITKICLWNPKAEDGLYGYVEHSYSRKNLWARLGNLFIGLGPLFSGLGVTVFILWLCFPDLWGEYLAHSHALVVSADLPVRDLAEGVFSLFGGIPGAFRSDWLRSLLGVIIILPVSLHVTLSGQDIRGSLSALPLYCVLMLLPALATAWNNGRPAVQSFLWLMNIRLLSLFILVIAFAAAWVAVALIYRAIRTVVGWF